MYLDFQKSSLSCLFIIHQAPVVQTLDRFVLLTLDVIYMYPVDTAIQSLNNWGQMNDFSYLISANLSNPKSGLCTTTTRSCHETPWKLNCQTHDLRLNSI